MGEIEMIDLHAHILPSLDDGAETLDESIEMCWLSYQDGIRTIVATPHILKGIYPNNRSTILAKVQELNEAIKKLRVQSSEFRSQILTHQPIHSCRTDSFKILPGADVHFSLDMLQLCENGEIVTVNDNGRYLMVEFDFQGIPYHAEDVLFQMIMHGIIPIITHPERNLEIARSPNRYYEIIKMGCLGQVTAMSLTGGFGRWSEADRRKIAQKQAGSRHCFGYPFHQWKTAYPFHCLEGNRKDCWQRRGSEDGD